MAEYRLTTLNLDDECREILGEQDNQSRYAREAIKRYGTVVDDLDRLEDRYVRLLTGSRRLADLINDAINYNWSLDELLTGWLDATSVEVGRMFQNGYLVDAIRAEMSRPSTL